MEIKVYHGQDGERQIGTWLSGFKHRRQTATASSTLTATTASHRRDPIELLERESHRNDLTATAPGSSEVTLLSRNGAH